MYNTTEMQRKIVDIANHLNGNILAHDVHIQNSHKAQICARFLPAHDKVPKLFTSTFHKDFWLINTVTSDCEKALQGLIENNYMPFLSLIIKWLKFIQISSSPQFLNIVKNVTPTFCHIISRQLIIPYRIKETVSNTRLTVQLTLSSIFKLSKASISLSA